MKNFNDTIGNRTRDLPACSAVPQPTAPPRALVRKSNYKPQQKFTNFLKIYRVQRPHNTEIKKLYLHFCGGHLAFCSSYAIHMNALGFGKLVAHGFVLMC